MEMNIFEVKAIEARVYGEVYEKLQYMLKDANTKWDKTGTKVQDYHWENGHSVLAWEDEEKTIPKMRDEYGNVPKEESDYTEEDRIRIDCIKKIQKMLEKAL